MHVVPEEEEDAAFLLLDVDPGRQYGEDVLACGSKEPSKTCWLMRTIALILLIGEAAWGSFLWVRRIRFEKYIAPTFSTPSCGYLGCDIVLYADSFLDHLNAAAVIGGFCTAAGSLGIHALNCSWTCSRRIAREATGPSQDRATQRVTGETLRLFSETRSYEMLLASFMQIAAEYRVLELFWVPAIMDMLRNALIDDALPLMLFLTIWNSIVCFLIPLAMFVMSFMFLFHIKLPRGLEKLIQSDAPSYLPGWTVALSLRPVFILSAKKGFRDLLSCSPEGNGFCEVPFLLWADPLSVEEKQLAYALFRIKHLCITSEVAPRCKTCG